MLTLLALTLMIDSDVFLDSDSFRDALAKAGREDKLVMVDFYTDWCGPCKLMDRTTFRDEKVRKLLAARFVSVKINTEVGAGIEIARDYRVTGYPSLMILDENGKVVSKHLGFMNARDFLAWLKKSS